MARNTPTYSKYGGSYLLLRNDAARLIFGAIIGTTAARYITVVSGYKMDTGPRQINDWWLSTQIPFKHPIRCLVLRSRKISNAAVLWATFFTISRWPFCEWRQLINENVSNIAMTSKWARWRLKSPASRLFTQPFIQAQIKENIKDPRHWPLWGEFTGDRWRHHEIYNSHRTFKR